MYISSSCHIRVSDLRVHPRCSRTPRRCEFGVLYLSCACVSVSGMLFSVGVCVCVYIYIYIYRVNPPDC